MLKTNFVKTRHIKMRREIDESFVSPEHLEKCSYKVFTSHHRYVVYCLYTILYSTYVTEVHPGSNDQLCSSVSHRDMTSSRSTK